MGEQALNRQITKNFNRGIYFFFCIGVGAPGGEENGGDFSFNGGSDKRLEEAAEGDRENVPEGLYKLGSSSTAELHPRGGGPSDEDRTHQMPPASVLTRLILIMVWRKLIRNPNTYSSLIGLVWSLIAFRLVKLLLHLIHFFYDCCSNFCFLWDLDLNLIKCHCIILIEMEQVAHYNAKDN